MVEVTHIYVVEVVMLRIVLACVALLLVASSIVAADRPVAPNGIAIYPDYMSWKVIAPSYRECERPRWKPLGLQTNTNTLNIIMYFTKPYLNAARYILRLC